MVLKEVGSLVPSHALVAPASSSAVPESPFTALVNRIERNYCE